MKTLDIKQNDAGQRLDKYLTKTLPSLPQSLLYKYLRTKRIKVNGKRAEISLRLQTGDKIDLYINDEFFAPKEAVYSFLGAGKQLKILFEDENILVLDKQPGLLSHPDDGEYVDTLITRVQRYLYEKGEYDPAKEASFAPALANRIDRNTGGVVLAAKTAEALRVLNEKLKNREIDKYYLCALIGKPPKKADTVESFMQKDEEKNKVKLYSHPVPGGKTMRTGYRVLAEKNGLTLAEIHLFTGRTHQIRAQMAALGCPLLGDGKYGTNEQNRRFGSYKKQCLYSYKTVFSFTTDAGCLNNLKGMRFLAADVPFLSLFDLSEPPTDA